MKKKYLIGTDIGSSSTKTVITDFHGNVLASATENYDIICPQNAWAEQWPDTWENAVSTTIRRVMKRSGVFADEVVSLCISGLYGGSGVPLDDAMEVVRPCIIWMDRRSEELCQRLKKTIDREELFRITGNDIDSYFGYTKILWIKENEPENWERIKLFLTPNQYIIYQYTGEIVIDRTSAGNLGGVFDLEKNEWSDIMLEKLGIPRCLLPQKIVNPTDIVGTLTAEAAANLKLKEGTPICAGCIDCLASTLSSGVYCGNQTVAVLATSLNWGLVHNDPPQNPQYITMPYLTNDHTLRYTYGGISTAGALTKWFARNLARGTSAEGSEEKEQKLLFRELEFAATEIPAGSEGLLMLPYFMGERTPIWDSKARGTMLGLTVKHTTSHLYRALMESVGYAMRHVMESYGFVSRPDTICRIVGGGTASKLWVQILADITGVKLECMTDGVEAPIGDAFLAGIGGGIFSDFSEIDRWGKSHMIFCPSWQNHEHYSHYYNIYKNLYPAIKDEMHALSDLGFSFG
ncbi:MAG: FGGY-family carbohydrate kinase [Clostridiales bacterium]|nr:FGGY-family carbohydrate kinase [Clostridiales bacterium]